MSIYEINTHEPDEPEPQEEPLEEPVELRYGVIAGFSGHPLSGLWTVHFQDCSSVHIHSGAGARAIAHCFGSLEAAKGQEIAYTVDAFGVMEGFSPAADVPEGF